MADKNFGTFEKDGRTIVAASQRQAIDLQFRGWAEKKPATKAAAAELQGEPKTS